MKRQDSAGFKTRVFAVDKKIRDFAVDLVFEFLRFFFEEGLFSRVCRAHKGTGGCEFLLVSSYIE